MTTRREHGPTLTVPSHVPLGSSPCLMPDLGHVVTIHRSRPLLTPGGHVPDDLPPRSRLSGPGSSGGGGGEAEGVTTVTLAA